jgi:hypothetical protein
MIRIDVHTVGKPRLTCHMLFTLDPRRVSDPTTHMIHIDNLSLVPTRLKHVPTPERSLGDQRQTDPAIALGHLILPPHDSLGLGERGFD